MYHCTECGHGLSTSNRCTNPECEQGPPQLCQHSIKTQEPCREKNCPNYLKDIDPAPVQLHCQYCEYTAGPDETCDDPDCPTHDPDFHPEPCQEPDCPTHGPVLQYSGTPRDTVPSWMVEDGLMFPDGRPTPLGERHTDWITPRLPQCADTAKPQTEPPTATVQFRITPDVSQQPPAG